jgi:anti-sigma factor RsiW
MTTCTGTPAEQNLEDYLLGTLPETEAEKFEEHYFDCPVCLAQLEALQAVTLKLRSEPRKPVKAPIPWPVRFAAPVRFAVLGAIAAMLVLGFFAFRDRRQTQQPAVAVAPVAPAPQTSPSTTPKPRSMATAAISHLADLTLPAFRAPNLRGASGDPQFEEGMKAYSSHDCPRAVKTLAQVPSEGEDSFAARFYSGVCLMHEGDLAGASKSLRGVADAGDSPQQEAAFYYLAQIALAGNDSTTARHYLSRTISLHGDLERRARAELNKVREGENNQ